MGSFQGMADRPAGNTSQALQQKGNGPENHLQRPAYVSKRLPVPVIAAIHGVAYGSGLQIALGADIRIAAAKLSIMEIIWGLIPDISLTQTLRHLVPMDVAKAQTFTGRVLSGDEAKQFGLVTVLPMIPMSGRWRWHEKSQLDLQMQFGLQKSCMKIPDMPMKLLVWLWNPRYKLR
jgi:enoyl-CoA hydratase/carnithine racemase